jgi:hypothetical protein
MKLKMKNKQKRNKGNSIIPRHPPQLNNYEITHSVDLRFTVTAAVQNQQITFANLLETILLATTAVAPYDLFEAVRIRRVRVWGQANLGTPSTVSVRYSGTSTGSVGDFCLHSDTSLGVEPARVNAAPNRRSQASQFQVASNTVAFLLGCPAGSIVDVALTFRSQPGFTLAATNASIGAPVGSTFYRGLDGLAVAATNFPVIPGVATF